MTCFRTQEELGGKDCAVSVNPGSPGRSQAADVQVCPEHATSVRLSPARSGPVNVLSESVSSSKSRALVAAHQPCLTIDRLRDEPAILRRNCFKTVQAAVAPCLVRTVPLERPCERRPRNRLSVRGTPFPRQPSAKELTPPSPQNRAWSLSAKVCAPVGPRAAAAGPSWTNKAGAGAEPGLGCRRRHLFRASLRGRGPRIPGLHQPRPRQVLGPTPPGPSPRPSCLTAATVPPRHPVTWAGDVHPLQAWGICPSTRLIRGPAVSQPSKQLGGTTDESELGQSVPFAGTVGPVTGQ